MVRLFSYPTDQRLFSHQNKAYKFDIHFSDKIKKHEVASLHSQVKRILVKSFEVQDKALFTINEQTITGLIKKRQWKYPQSYVGSSMQMKRANFSYQVHISPLNVNDTEIETLTDDKENFDDKIVFLNKDASSDQVLCTSFIDTSDTKAMVNKYPYSDIISPFKVIEKRVVTTKRANGSDSDTYITTDTVTETSFTNAETYDKYRRGIFPCQNQLSRLQIAGSSQDHEKPKPWFVTGANKKRKFIKSQENDWSSPEFKKKRRNFSGSYKIKLDETDKQTDQEVPEQLSDKSWSCTVM